MFGVSGNVAACGLAVAEIDVVALRQRRKGGVDFLRQIVFRNITHHHEQHAAFDEERIVIELDGIERQRLCLFDRGGVVIEMPLEKQAVGKIAHIAVGVGVARVDVDDGAGADALEFLGVVAGMVDDVGKRAPGVFPIVFHAHARHDGVIPARLGVKIHRHAGSFFAIGFLCHGGGTGGGRQGKRIRLEQRVHAVAVVDHAAAQKQFHTYHIVLHVVAQQHPHAVHVEILHGRNLGGAARTGDEKSKREKKEGSFHRLKKWVVNNIVRNRLAVCQQINVLTIATGPPCSGSEWKGFPATTKHRAHIFSP